jgi:hypothetical protein
MTTSALKNLPVIDSASQLGVDEDWIGEKQEEALGTEKRSFVRRDDDN